MQTYDSEYKELTAWLLKKDAEYEAAWAMKYIKEGRYVGGHDSPETYQHQLDIQEYNRRLKELKAKYGRK